MSAAEPEMTSNSAPQRAALRVLIATKPLLQLGRLESYLIGAFMVIFF